MKIRLQTLLPAVIFAIFPALISCNSHVKEVRVISDTARSFLESFYTCEFETASELCSESGVAELRWFASNLSEEELSLVVRRPKIETGAVEINHSDASSKSGIEMSESADEVSNSEIAVVSFEADDVLVVDSLEKAGYIGHSSGKVMLKKKGQKWLVTGLEW